jgi:hypothetical protein
MTAEAFVGLGAFKIMFDRAKGLKAPAFAGSIENARSATPMLELRPDLDAIEVLTIEREALWARVQAFDFLTLNEKRAAVGYGAVDGGDALGPPP